MQLDFHQVDAFTDRPFTGNPAMVYRLEAWLPDALLQQIALEHNLSETVFVVREAGAWKIRWFTPLSEVPLCGHATLACAHVLFEIFAEPGDCLVFDSWSGPLRVFRANGRLALDFPAQPASHIEQSAQLEKLLGQKVQETLANASHWLAVLDSEQAVRACEANFPALAQLPCLGVIITAPGREHDFVSRFFAPALGINEDPVTGSAHCSLIPYWAERLGKSELRAHQCSARGGWLDCQLQGDRVRIAGQARLVARGQLLL